MNGSSKYSGPSAAAKGKRKAPSDGHNPTPGPSSLPGMAAPSRGVGRQIAPKPSSINPDPKCAPIVGSEPPQLRKRSRLDHASQPASGSFLGPEVTPTSEQSMNHDTWSQRVIRHTDTTLEGSNTLAFGNVIQGSECQNLGIFDPSPDLQKTTYAEAACSSLPSIFQVPTTTMIAGDFQASVGCCPQCHALLRNLRESILTITCGEGLPSSGGAMGDLWKSYFRLQDHWSEGHVFGATGLVAGVEV